MSVPFHGVWIWLRNLSGRNNGTSIFEERPFGRLTGGHWTGYALWVLVITAAALLLMKPDLEGWFFYGSPVVFGLAIAIALRRRSQRVINRTIPPPPHEEGSPKHRTLRSPKRRGGFGSERTRFDHPWGPRDGHVRPFGG